MMDIFSDILCLVLTAAAPSANFLKCQYVSCPPEPHTSPSAQLHKYRWKSVQISSSKEQTQLSRPPQGLAVMSVWLISVNILPTNKNKR